MAISFVPTPYSGKFPVFWRGEAKVLPGGYSTQQSFAVGFTIPKGTLASIVPGTLEAVVIKRAVVLAGGTTSAARVKKGNVFQVGDVVSNGTNSGTIASIDRSNSTYDVLNFSAAITGLAADDVLSESGVTAEPNAVISADCTIKAVGHVTLTLAYEAIILADAVPYVDALGNDLFGICLSGNPSIKFIKQ